MTQLATVSPHDCVGSNLYAHVLRGTVKRVVPRENESINEAWISDRDRFSYEAIYSGDRLAAPLVKESGEWREISWDEALSKAADALSGADADKIGFLASPGVTVEEAHLVVRLAEHLGTNNLDHRISRRDFTDQANDPLFPWLGCDIADIEEQDAIFVVGSNIRREAPILAHRIRKAALAGASVSFASGSEHEYFFDVAQSLSGSGLAEMLAGVAIAAAGNKALPASIADICSGVKSGDAHSAIAKSLADADDALILLGNVAGRHGAYSAVRALAAAIAALTGAKLGTVSEGANSAGAHLAGLLPHRGQGGKARSSTGLNASSMLDNSLDVVVLVNVEADADLHATVDVAEKLAKQAFVVALTPFVSDAMLEASDLLLPIGTFAETSGTYVNVAGTWQSFAGIANPVGQARPAWKVLRVIGNLVDAPDFDYVASEDVRDEILAKLGDVEPVMMAAGITRIATPGDEDSPESEIDIPLYSVDGMVRRANALQLTAEARRARDND